MRLAPLTWGGSFRGYLALRQSLFSFHMTPEGQFSNHWMTVQSLDLVFFTYVFSSKSDLYLQNNKFLLITLFQLSFLRAIFNSRIIISHLKANQDNLRLGTSIWIILLKIWWHGIHFKAIGPSNFRDKQWWFNCLLNWYRPEWTSTYWYGLVWSGMDGYCTEH